jgi:octaprenyl-diphosphate synthase
MFKCESIDNYTASLKDYISSKIIYEKIEESIINRIPIKEGKYLRSALLFYIFKIYLNNVKESEKQINDLISFGASIEMIHMSTLLHDDVIDSANERRGVESLNAAIGNRLAILSGDLIFSLSFRLMSEKSDGNQEVLKVISKSCESLVYGEIFEEKMLKNSSLSMEEYREIVKGKTAELFSAACSTGALLAGIDGIEAGKFGENFGIAFQILDDLLDYTADSKKTGKQRFRDFFEKKITFPILLLREKCTKEDFQVIHEFFTSDSELKISDAEMVVAIFEKYNILLDVKKVIHELVDSSIKILKSMPDNKYRSNLIDMCDKFKKSI